MSKKFFMGACALLAVFSAAQANAEDTVVPDQLELCGAYQRIAPWCGESLEVDTRELQSMQAIVIPLTPEVSEEWQRIHREKRRGISFTLTGEDGKLSLTGRPVIAAVSRAIAVPPSGNMDEAMLFQALLSPDLLGVTVLLPAGEDFSGWSVLIPSGEAKHALTLDGQLVRLSGRHRTDDHLTLDFDRLPTSYVTSTLLVRRGDGSNAIEALEATFTDHTLVHDRDGSFRVYSGLPGTFTPISEDGTSVLSMYTNCRKAGQRVLERGNLRLDTGNVVAAVATSGVTAAPQIVQNGLAVLGLIGCRK